MTRFSDPVLAGLVDWPCSVLADAAAILGLGDICLDPGVVRPLAGTRLLGRAVTIALGARAAGQGPGDDDPALRLAIRQAVDEGGPDHVVVIATGGDVSHANWGGNLALRARMVGLGGVVTDGAVRDVDEVVDSGVAVYAQATSPRAGPRHFAVIGRDRPVVCAGRRICPGDVIVADADGVVVLPPDQVEALLAQARILVTAEEAVHAALAGGATLVAAARLKG